MGKTRNVRANRILTGMFDAQRQLGGPRRKWTDTGGINVKETAWQKVEWVQLTKDMEEWRSLVNTEIRFWFSQCSRNFWTR